MTLDEFGKRGLIASACKAAQQLTIACRTGLLSVPPRLGQRRLALRHAEVSKGVFLHPYTAGRDGLQI
jgi:hypothetical protein